jgi:uncharacterized protein
VRRAVPGGVGGRDQVAVVITGEMPLIDQHCHGVVGVDLDDTAFAGWLTEAPTLPAHRDPFDSMLGLAVRRWCAPVLDLPALAARDAYLRRRAELGWREVTARLLGAAGVTNWLVDTGFTPPEPLIGLGAGVEHEVVRIEQVAETLVAQGESTLSVLRSALRERAGAAVGLKTVIGYRSGLAIPAKAPADRQAQAALDRLARVGGRLTEPYLAHWLVHEAARIGEELGLPLQVHTGFGDPDLRLHLVDPALLHVFLESTMDSGLTVVLLHCWPFHRNAGYLAHAFGHAIVDIGLMLPFVGDRSRAVLAETLELAPFDSVVYSSDGRALPETHFLAAALWRHHFGRLLDEWIREGIMTTPDAERLAHAVGAGNAKRIYRLA